MYNIGRNKMKAEAEKAKAIGKIAEEAFELLAKADYAMGIVIEMTKGKVQSSFEEGRESVKDAEAIIKDILPK